MLRSGEDGRDGSQDSLRCRGAVRSPSITLLSQAAVSSDPLLASPWEAWLPLWAVSLF